MKTISVLCGLALTASMFGCNAPVESDSQGSDPEETTEGETFTETVVQLNEDGTQTVTTRIIDQAEEDRQVALRDMTAAVDAPDLPDGVGHASSAIATKDAGCVGASFWLYDQLNRTGNKICFTGVGAVKLADYLDCNPGQDPATCPTWAQGVAHHSYWAGSSWGHFQERFPNCVNLAGYHCPDFAPYQASEFLSWCEAFKPYINLGDNTCIPPTVSVDWQSPMTASGYNFTPGGSVKIQVLNSNGVSLFSNMFQNADASGNLQRNMGMGYKDGIQCTGNNCGSCGETIKMTDVTSGASASTPSHVCYEPSKS